MDKPGIPIWFVNEMMVASLVAGQFTERYNMHILFWTLIVLLVVSGFLNYFRSRKEE